MLYERGEENKAEDVQKSGKKVDPFFSKTLISTFFVCPKKVEKDPPASA